MTKVRISLLIALMFPICCANNISGQVPLQRPDSRNPQPGPRSQGKRASIENTIGVVVLSDHYGKNDFVRIYNADRSLWYEFTYYY